MEKNPGPSGEIAKRSTFGTLLFGAVATFLRKFWRILKKNEQNFEKIDAENVPIPPKSSIPKMILFSFSSG